MPEPQIVALHAAKDVLNPEARLDVNAHHDFAEALLARAYAEHQRHPLVQQQPSELGQQLGIVLAVGVHGHRRCEAPRDSLLERAVQGTVIAAIDLGADAHGAVPGRYRASVVGRAIVDDDHRTESARRGDQRTDGLRLAIGRDQDREARSVHSNSFPASLWTTSRLPRMLPSAHGGTAPAGQGRSASRWCSARTVPAGRAALTRNARRWMMTVSCSLGSIRLTPSPSEHSSSRVASTIDRQVAGLSANEWSGPSRLLSSVKCFSTTRAPSATAPSTAEWPGVWSEKPSTMPGQRIAKLCSTRRLTYLKFSRLPV